MLTTKSNTPDTIILDTNNTFPTDSNDSEQNIGFLNDFHTYYKVSGFIENNTEYVSGFIPNNHQKK